MRNKLRKLRLAWLTWQGALLAGLAHRVFVRQGAITAALAPLDPGVAIAFDLAFWNFVETLVKARREFHEGLFKKKLAAGMAKMKRKATVINHANGVEEYRFPETEALAKSAFRPNVCAAREETKH